jgi:hypothetical protein
MGPVLLGDPATCPASSEVMANSVSDHSNNFVIQQMRVLAALKYPLDISGHTLGLLQALEP